MSEKCNPTYKNLELITSAGEQKYGTVQWAKQNCANDEYLKRKTDELYYLSPPAIRKRNYQIPVDELSSWGYQINSNNEITFSTKTTEKIHVDFFDMDLIDNTKSDCAFESYVDDGVVHSRAVVPNETTKSTDLQTKHPDWGKGTNSFWYVGHDKNVPYYITNDWLNDPKKADIPSIARAQTFKCVNGGLLESLSLSIQNTGETTQKWGSPLYVQIWATEEKTYANTVWDSKKKKSVPSSGTTKIHVPKGDIYKPLAECKLQPDQTNPDIYAFVFDSPAKLESGKYYAIVMFSPLSHPQHHPRIGGWGRNCTIRKYDYGDAFLSENNGRKWERYGRNDDDSTLPYKFGKYTPQDFAFECKIVNYTTGRDTEEDYYLYLKPIFANNITSISISGGSFSGESTLDNEDGIFLDFEFSTKGTNDNANWTSIRSGETKYLEEPCHYVFLRAKMHTDDAEKTPAIEELYVTLETTLPDEMYVRSIFYTPKLSPMLGATHWGRVFAPVELSPNDENINATIEIIPDRLNKEHFSIITVSELEEFLLLEDDEGIILDEDSIIGVSDDNRAKYLIDNPSIVTRLKRYNVYVKPYTYNEQEYLLSFEDGVDDEENPIYGGLHLTNSPAYPIQGCTIQPAGTERVQSYGEWYDYKVNYDTDIITIDRTVLDNMPIGALCFEYNPVFVQDLTPEETGLRVNDDGVVEEGFLLDYMEEEFIIDESNVESRSVNLRVLPVDPIRSVILNKGTENETTLYEDLHYNVDYVNKKLVFPIINTDGKSSILQINDTLNVVYTPNLEDVSLSIGYRVKRSQTDYQCRIKSNYLEYKV